MLVTHIGKKDFAAALNAGKLQLKVRKWESQNMETALSHTIKHVRAVASLPKYFG